MEQNNKGESKKPLKRNKKRKAAISSRRRESNRITVILGIICALFVGIIIYLSYFQIIKSDEIAKHESNRRAYVEQEKTLRGTITDRNGETLVHSEFDNDGNQQRIYDKPYNYSHIIGYSYKSYGNSGLEDSYNSQLLNLRTQHSELDKFKDIITDEEQRYGNNLQITIDDTLQSKAFEMLEGKRGSIILMNPKDGEIYAMASNPGFNVSNLTEEWANIVEREDSPLINRATAGLYPPGSIFKIITSTGILENLDPTERYTSTGSTKIDGYTLRDFNEIPYGDVDLKDAFRQSVNTYFAEKGLELGQDKIVELAQRYMVNKNIPFDIATNKSIFQTKKMTQADLGATSIGQGKTLVTPLNMVLMASSIANEGQMVKPVLVKQISDHEGNIIQENGTETISTVCSPEIAAEIKEMMISVVNQQGGTGSDAAIRNVTLAGKTGTAEVEGENSHAWFVGFAPAEAPRVAVVVMLENAGNTGGKAAGPIARDMVIDGLNRIGYAEE